MKIVFTDFVVDPQRLPDESVAIEFTEAMAGEGPDGQRGIVGTGNSFHVRMDNETVRNLVIELAITSGMMKDQDTPDVADMSVLREEIAKRTKKGQG